MAKYPQDRSVGRLGLPGGYWEIRKDKELYNVMRLLAGHYAQEARSAIDVGCYVGGFICDLDWIQERVAVDMGDWSKEWADVDGVSFIQADAFKMKRTKGFFRKRANPFDLVISNQTIEHVEDAQEFAENLCDLGYTVLVSTTYQVPAGKIEGHIQDPIDMEKFLSWFPRKPKAITIINEAPIDNIIGVF